MIVLCMTCCMDIWYVHTCVNNGCCESDGWKKGFSPKNPTEQKSDSTRTTDAAIH